MIFAQTSFLIDERGGDDNAGYVSAGYFGGKPQHSPVNPLLTHFLASRLDPRSCRPYTRFQVAGPSHLNMAIVNGFLWVCRYYVLTNAQHFALNCAFNHHLGHAQYRGQRDLLLLYWCLPRPYVSSGHECSGRHLTWRATRGNYWLDCQLGSGRECCHAIVSDLSACEKQSLIYGDHSITGAISEKVSLTPGMMCPQDLPVHFLARRLDPSAIGHCFHEYFAPSLDVCHTRQPSQSAILVYPESYCSSARQGRSRS